MSEVQELIDARAGDDLSPLTGTWKVDPTHSSLEFVARYAVYTRVRGRFTSFRGTLLLDPLHLDVMRVDVEIDAASIDTALPERDRHLLGHEFFDVDRHPTIAFHAVGATVLAAGRYVVHGALALRGVDQPVRLIVEGFGCAPDVRGTPRLALRATATVQRGMWGVTWNAPVPGGGVVLAQDVELDLDASLVPAGVADATSAGS
jgi:polyisoprenoid-binding protein YceI